MPLDPDKRVLFLHVPKTGGTTVNDFFGFRRKGRKTLFGNIRQGAFFSKGPTCYHHQPLERLLEWDFLNERILRNFYVFSFVRDPYDRIASEYRSRSYGYPDLKQHKSFEAFVDHVAEVSEKVGERPWETRSLDYYYNHLLPQYHFLYRDGECVCNDVFRYEDFAGGVKRALSEAGMEVPDNVPKKNASEGESTESLFERFPRCEEVVREVYAKDFELFWY